MPCYEYKCCSCDHHFEELQKINDPVLTSCPRCGKNVERLFSKTGLIKGSQASFQQATGESPFGRASGFLERFQQVQQHNEKVDRGEV